MDKTDNIKNSICKFLRSKNSFGLSEGGDNPWYLIDETNAIFHCIFTGRTAGPDNKLSSPEDCQKGRICFQE